MCRGMTGLFFSDTMLVLIEAGVYSFMSVSLAAGSKGKISCRVPKQLSLLRPSEDRISLRLPNRNACAMILHRNSKRDLGRKALKHRHHGYGTGQTSNHDILTWARNENPLETTSGFSLGSMLSMLLPAAFHH